MYQGEPTAGSPLLVAAPGHFMEDIIGVILLNKTMLTLPMICMNLTIFAITLIVFPRLVPKKNYETVDEERLKKFERDMALDTYEEDVSMRTFAEKSIIPQYSKRLSALRGCLSLPFPCIRAE